MLLCNDLIVWHVNYINIHHNAFNWGAVWSCTSLKLLASKKPSSYLRDHTTCYESCMPLQHSRQFISNCILKPTVSEIQSVSPFQDQDFWNFTWGDQLVDETNHAPILLNNSLSEWSLYLKTCEGIFLAFSTFTQLLLILKQPSTLFYNLWTRRQF